MNGKSEDPFVTVTTAFSDRDIRVQAFEGTEQLGRPFEYSVELLSEDDALDLEKQLGQPLTVAIVTRNDELRHFSGIVSHVSYTGPKAHRSSYVAVLRPWIWFLNHASDNRIFQNMDVPEILAEVFSGHGFSAKKSLSGSYRKREYCVQYGETDFDFASRLMEEEGIYYFFEHKKDGHDLVLADSPNAHADFPEYKEVQFFPPDAQFSRDEDHIDHWQLEHQVETTKIALDSYNYETPDTNLKAQVESSAKRDHGESGREMYEYGTLYPVQADGETTAKVMVEEQQAAFEVGSGGGDVLGIASGFTFELAGYPREDQNRKYLVVSARFGLQNSDPETGAAGAGASFTCFFRAIPEQTQYRPSRITPKSRVKGPQTAVVVGPSGEEIYTDKYGRVKVQFHWDRKGKNDEKSSCWCRVSTALAGQNFGMIVIPRIGHEVIVDFLEGDPDQPIVVGSVYNDNNKPPYSLPDNMTQSGIKTRSSQKGTPKNFNELRFEDKKDKEEVFLHAETNMKRVVKNNDVLEVGLVKKDKGDQEITIQNDRTVTLNEGNDSLTVTEGDQAVDITAGNQDVNVGKKITIKAGDQLSITVGQAKLVMKKNGQIDIKGMNISVNGTNITLKANASIKAKANAQAEIKGTMTKVEGSGILDLKAGGMAKLKGGITMIG